MTPIQKFQFDQGLKPDGDIGRLTFGAFRTKFKLTGIEAAHALGQAGHESANFSIMEENLKYSKEGLLRVFATRYNADLAQKHEYKPSVIANHVYGGRMGNNSPNDGFLFRGRGPLQITGRSNVTAFSEYVKDPEVIFNPGLIATKYAMESIVWFFEKNNLFKLCTDMSDSTILTISRAVNIGNPKSTKTPNGLDDRIKKTKFYSQFI